MSDDIEATCQRCGGNNPTWSVDSDRFNMAVEALGLTKVGRTSLWIQGDE
jgi:hypothetical protein